MKKIISFVLAASMLFSGFSSAVASSFNDYTGSSFYYDSIELLAERGIVQGYGDGSYGYSDSINRAEFMKILIETKYLGQNMEFLNSYTDEGCFKDVEADKWYTGYVCYGSAMGWVNGYPDGTFRPGDSINFVEAVKIILNTLGVPYNDGKVDPWYKGMVDAAGENHLIPMTIDDFGQTINRAEMADMVARKIKGDEGGLNEFLGDKNDYVVTFDVIVHGNDMYSNWQNRLVSEVYDDLSISSITSDLFSVTMKIDAPLLKLNELYHYECLEDGKSPMFAKMLNTSSKSTTFDGLNSNTLYNCWASVIDAGGNEYMTTDVLGIRTLGVFEKVQIIDYSATDSEISLRLDAMKLESGDKYFVECVEVGSDDMFFPELTSTSTTLVLDDSGKVPVKPDTEYSCYAAISPSSGVNKYISNPVKITTAEPKLDIVSFEVFDNYVKFEVDPVDLNKGEYYFAQCLKDGNLGPYGNPHDSGTDTSFSIFGFKSNTDYECTVEILGSSDPDYQPSKILGFKTKSNVNQVPLTKAYSGVDKDGVYIVVGTSANINADETYFYSCTSDDETESVMDVTHDKEVLLRLSQPYTSYRCSIAVGNEYYSHDSSEYIWLVTP